MCRRRAWLALADWLVYQLFYFQRFSVEPCAPAESGIGSVSFERATPAIYLLRCISRLRAVRYIYLLVTRHCPHRTNTAMSHRLFSTLACRACFLIIVLSSSAAAAGDDGQKPVDYSRDIKPILASHCYACHGPDQGQRKGGIRLDVRESAVRKAIKPGKAAASRLVTRITSTDPEEVMPPPDSKKPALTPDQVTLLRRWIDSGAKFDAHWAYIKPARSALPMVANPGWVRTPIDRFIAAGHQRHGLTPAAEADRRTLLRRLSFDLLGLPPTPEEVDAFVSDQSPDAYEKVVDRLLRSPHYGERLALYWLDLVRYADTIGYHSDTHRDVAPYRDYVINAFNTNKPFDRFTIEQVAGDLLPDSTSEQQIASGYNRMLMTTEEGGAQPKEYMAKYAADRVRNASGVWLGATLGCAECHNHKFDPYLTRDFYRFATFFADIKETAVGKQEQTGVPTPEQAAQARQLKETITGLRQRIVTHRTPSYDAAQAAWESQTRGELASGHSDWVTMKPSKVATRSGTVLTTQDDLSVLASGVNPNKEVYTVTLTTDRPNLTGIRLETLTHPSLANNGLSRANGNFVLTEFTVSISHKGEKSQPVKIASAVADFEQAGFPVANTIDGKPDTGWAVEGHVKPANRAAMFILDKPLVAGTETTLTVVLSHTSSFAGHNIGRFRLALTSADKPTLANRGLPAAVADALAARPEALTSAQRKTLADYYRGIAPELAPLRDQLARLESDLEQLKKTFPKTLISVSVPPRTMRVLPRGNWLDDSGEVITPGVPVFLSTGESDRRQTRLDLAHWLTASDNPLVARVFVNRLWKIVFGQGIVTSIDDFGTQGAMPSHPELLDWLAVEFIESGWNVKHLVKLMVMSSTYRQSSAAPTSSARMADLTNRWLARQGRFRLDAEMVRDNALAVSGLLVDKVGGRSAKPFQPPGYWSFLNFPKREYEKDASQDQYRRGLYMYWCRTFLHPSLLAFDAPTREECTADRPRSSTPLQALVLLNDPNYVEAARVFAQHIITTGGDTLPRKIDYAYRRGLARAASPAEVEILSRLYHKHAAEYAANPQAARELVSVGDTPLPASIATTELAAWTSVSRVILNLHETVTRE